MSPYNNKLPVRRGLLLCHFNKEFIYVQGVKQFLIRNIQEIFNGLVPEPLIKDIIDNYEEYKNIPLTKLGIDSLVMIGILLEIDKLFNLKIDYENFDLNMMKTLQSLENFIEGSFSLNGK